jgi:hypothetical protein
MIPKLTEQDAFSFLCDPDLEDIFKKERVEAECLANSQPVVFWWAKK